MGNSKYVDQFWNKNWEFPFLCPFVKQKHRNSQFLQFGFAKKQKQKQQQNKTKQNKTKNKT